MYWEVLGLVLLVGVNWGQIPQSPTIDCSTMALLDNSVNSRLTVSSEPFPHEISCVRGTTSVDGE